MEFLLQAEEKVKYACSCGYLKSIAKIYFCRHCTKIRCGYCVSHEVDLHYCGNCLENLPSTEARLKKNRCGYCFNCPSCQNIVNVRAVSSSLPHPEDATKLVSKKFYYLACGFCRWTSREASIPDQSTASGGWPERESPHAKRIGELVEYYQEMVLLEKIEEKKKFQPRPSYFHYAEKFGIGAVVARKRLSTPPCEQRQSQINIQQAKASDKIEPLDEKIFDVPIDLTTVTSMPQRLASPDIQPYEVRDLYPVHKQLLAKRSLRCRECEHNVSKPEFNPSSTKFKIQLSAFYHVPDVRFLTCEPIYPGKRSELIITICNPTQHSTTVTLLQLSQDHPREIVQPIEQQEEQTDGDTVSSLVQQLTIGDSLKSTQFTVNGSIELPEGSIQLHPRDDAAEFDETSKAPAIVDDAKVVAWRKGNKVALKLGVIPEEAASGQLGVAFLLQYIYTNTMTTLEKKEPQTLTLHCPVYLNAGNIFRNVE